MWNWHEAWRDNEPVDCKIVDFWCFLVKHDFWNESHDGDRLNQIHQGGERKICIVPMSDSAVPFSDVRTLIVPPLFYQAPIVFHRQDGYEQCVVSGRTLNAHCHHGENRPLWNDAVASLHYDAYCLSRIGEFCGK